MHAAVGDAAWFKNGTRAQDLAEGFAEGCRQSNAVWGGGETPAVLWFLGVPIPVLLLMWALGWLH